MATNLPLRTRWLTAMRRSTTRAIGRECDFALTDDDVDAYDPLGLLAWLSESEHDSAFVTYPGCDGMYVSRQQAGRLAASVGFPEDRLAELAELNDLNTPWAALADYVQACCELEDETHG